VQASSERLVIEKESNLGNVWPRSEAFLLQAIDK